MNINDLVESQLKDLGADLRSRGSLTSRVMEEVHKTRPVVPKEKSITPIPRVNRLLATAASVAAVAITMFAVVFLRTPSTVWADVTKALESQEWIRGTFDDGRTIWLSPTHQVWACRLGSSFYFFDGGDQTKYQFHPNDEQIVKLPLGEQDAESVLPLAALLNNRDAVSPWILGTEKVVQQERINVIENGKTWTEFKLVLSRGEMTSAKLRVDPETKLPVYMSFSSPEDGTKSTKLQFDYPGDGPTDIYALGVSREITIDNQVPSNDAMRVVRAMAGSRAQIGDFRLLVAEEGDGRTFIASRKANRWRIDQVGDHTSASPEKPAQGQSVADWFAERLSLSPRHPLYVCDGKAVYRNRSLDAGAAEVQWSPVRDPSPQDLMSGDGLGIMSLAPNVKLASLVYPDLSPKHGWPFEFDSHPVEWPSYVTIKRSAQMATAAPLLAHEWYYIDPSRSYAVVQADLFTLPANVQVDPNASEARQTIRMEDFEQSPHGFWYPTKVYSSNPRSGQTPRVPMAPSSAAAPITQQTESGVVTRSEVLVVTPVDHTVRYQFDFDAELPESLFTVEPKTLRN